MAPLKSSDQYGEGREDAQLRTGEETATGFDGRRDRDDTQRTAVAEARIKGRPIIGQIGEGGCSLDGERTPEPEVRPDADTEEMSVSRGAGDRAIAVDPIAGEALIREPIARPSPQGEVVRGFHTQKTFALPCC